MSAHRRNGPISAQLLAVRADPFVVFLCPLPAFPPLNVKTSPSVPAAPTSILVPAVPVETVSVAGRFN